LSAPCLEPACCLAALIRDGDEDVYCDTRVGGCGRRWSWEDYRRLVLVLASEQGAT
jgi:hypothetical protein